jgi:hypothetical protein
MSRSGSMIGRRGTNTPAAYRDHTAISTRASAGAAASAAAARPRRRTGTRQARLTSPYGGLHSARTPDDTTASTASRRRSGPVRTADCRAEAATSIAIAVVRASPDRDAAWYSDIGANPTTATTQPLPGYRRAASATSAR